VNFFEQQAQHRSASRWLALLFVLAVALVVAPIGLLFGKVAGISALSLIVLCSAWQSLALRAGGPAVARLLRATPLTLGSEDLRRQRLRNVVEEMSIASGVTAPQLFVLAREPGINAFAAGFSPTDAVLVLTRGALDKLTRDELQGVIAHEFSHILNGDMRLSMRMMGLIFGLSAIFYLGSLLASVVPRAVGGALDDGDGDAEAKGSLYTLPLLLLGLLFMVLGSVGVLCGLVIKATLSRQRESLADASAVQFTRQDAGLAGALKKCLGLRQGSKLRVPQAERVSHMLFADGLQWSWFSTHPPLLARIRALEPGFSVSSIAELAPLWNSAAWVAEPADGDRSPAPPPAAPAFVAMAPPQTAAIAPQRQVSAQVGRVSDQDLRQATTRHAAMPGALLQAARSSDSAPDLILGLLLEADGPLRQTQLQDIGAVRTPAGLARVQQLAGVLPGMDPASRLPLACLAFPALRELPPRQLVAFLGVAARMSKGGGQDALFKYCLAHMLRLQIMDALQPARSQPPGKLKLDACSAELQMVFGVIARQGNADAHAVMAAYQAGLEQVLPHEGLPYAPPADWMARLDAALARLDQLVPLAKQQVVDGLALTVAHDGRITIGEAELLRVVCAALHCPLPASVGM